MKQEDKELLFKDLCARIPYSVKLNIINREPKNRIVELTEDNICHLANDWWSECKPYLFPMSSMTEEQKEEFIQCAGYEAREEENGYHYETYYYDLVGHENVMFPDCDGFDWLNKNHFDYRGLIPMGLAIDCTNLNIY